MYIVCAYVRTYVLYVCVYVYVMCMCTVCVHVMLNSDDMHSYEGRMKKDRTRKHIFTVPVDVSTLLSNS